MVLSYLMQFISFEVAGVQARNMQTMVWDVENIGGESLLVEISCWQGQIDYVFMMVRLKGDPHGQRIICADAGAALMNRVQCDDNNAAMGEDGVSRENSSWAYPVMHKCYGRALLEHVHSAFGFDQNKMW